MYNMTIKNLITNFFSFFTIFFTILLLSSCSLYSFLGMDQKENKSFVNEDKYKKIKCPKTVVPRKSSIFLSSGNTYKSIVKLRKLKLICKIKSDENSLNKILFINYKAEISIKSISLKNKDILNLPKVYLAIINEKNNSVSAKILANTNIKANNNTKKITYHITENKINFKIKNNLDDINIYFGFQIKPDSL